MGKQGPKKRISAEKGRAVTFYCGPIAYALIEKSKTKSRDISRWIVNGYFADSEYNLNNEIADIIFGHKGEVSGKE